MTEIKLMTTSEAAKFLRLKEDTLLIWRCTKRYDLPYIKIGRKVFYKLSDLENFIESRTVQGGELCDN